MPLKTATKGILAAKRWALAISSAAKLWLLKQTSKNKLTTPFLLILFIFPINQSASFTLSNTREREEREEIGSGKKNGFRGYFPSLFERDWDENVELNFTFSQFYRSDADRITYSTGTPELSVTSHLSEVGTQGVPLNNSYQFWESFSFLARPSSHLALEWKANAGWREGSDSWTHIQKAFVEARWKKFIFAVGRKPIYWGQSYVSPLLVGDHAQNFDLIEISTLPVDWFSWSRWKAQVFISRMNSERVPAHDYFFGWRLGSILFSKLEWNIGLIYQLKGEGMPSGSFKSYILEFLGTRSGRPSEDELQAGGNSDVTNRAVALDLRLRMDDITIPFHIYTEQHLEDCCGSLKTIYTKSYNYIYGVTLPWEDRWSLGTWDMEWIRTATALYYHHRWRSSLSNRGQLAGHPLGADSHGFYMRWKKDFWRLDFSWERRRLSGDITERARFERFNPRYESPETTLSMGLRKYWLVHQNLKLETSGMIQRLFHQNYGASNSWEASVFAGLEILLYPSKVP